MLPIVAAVIFHTWQVVEGNTLYLFYLKAQYIGLLLPHSQLDLSWLLFLFSPRFSLSKQGSNVAFLSQRLCWRQANSKHFFKPPAVQLFLWEKSPWPSSFLKQRKHNTWFSLPRGVSSVLFHNGPFRNQSKSPGHLVSWPCNWSKGFTLSSDIVPAPLLATHFFGCFPASLAACCVHLLI